MLKFAVMRSNEDYYTMRAAKRGEKQANNEDLWQSSLYVRAEVKELEQKEEEEKELRKNWIGKKKELGPAWPDSL